MGNWNLLWCYSFSLNGFKCNLQNQKERNHKHLFFLWKNKSGIHVHQKCVRCGTLCSLLWLLLSRRYPVEVVSCCSEDVSHTHYCRTHLVQNLTTLQCVAVLVLLRHINTSALRECGLFYTRASPELYLHRASVWF